MNAYRWEDLREGLSHEFEVTLTETMLRQFAEFSGDNNPLHADIEFARQAGYQNVLAHGMLTSSFYSRLVGVYLPGRFALLHGMDLDFVHPAFAGDQLLVSGAIAHLSSAYRRVEVKATICTTRNQLISKAKIRVGVHER